MVNEDIRGTGADEHTVAAISALINGQQESVDFQDMSVQQPLAAYREEARWAVLINYRQSSAFERHGFVVSTPGSPFGGPKLCDRDRVFGCSWSRLQLPLSWCAVCPG